MLSRTTTQPPAFIDAYIAGPTSIPDAILAVFDPPDALAFGITGPLIDGRMLRCRVGDASQTLALGGTIMTERAWRPVEDADIGAVRFIDPDVWAGMHPRRRSGVIRH